MPAEGIVVPAVLLFVFLYAIAIFLIGRWDQHLTARQTPPYRLVESRSTDGFGQEIVTLECSHQLRLIVEKRDVLPCYACLEEKRDIIER